MRWIMLLPLFLYAHLTASAQVSFVKVLPGDNDLAAHSGTKNYHGVSWVDYNGDGREDCFINPNFLYRNEGEDNFRRVTFAPNHPGLGNGNSWADFDGDGDLDVIIAASPTQLYRNQKGRFHPFPLTKTPIDTCVFWSAAWGDYNQDGWVDLFLSHPAGFLPAPDSILIRSSLLLKNEEGNTFKPVDSPVDDEQAAHTIGSWTDYDQDGDLDLFIGSGEVNHLSRDHLFVNQLHPSGTAEFTRLQTGALAEGLRDGQHWNFIDYDLDGDLDAFVTNFHPEMPNELYRNDNGAYRRQTVEEAGRIAGQPGHGLNNIWEDFDNDGFQDCVVVFDGGQQDRYYHNNGDGSFTEVEQPFFIHTVGRGAAAADYNQDGFPDLMISAAADGQSGLYRNLGNDNHWLVLRLSGNPPNTAAIGGKVWVNAKIKGLPRQQFREVSAQNTFNGHNSLRAHFGLGTNNQGVDEVLVEWPDGSRTRLLRVQPNQHCTIYQNGDTDCRQLPERK